MKFNIEMDPVVVQSLQRRINNLKIFNDIENTMKTNRKFPISSNIA